jgi:hypothetical protein
MTVSWKKATLGALTALALGSAYATPAAAWCNGWGCGGGYNAGPAVAAGVIGGMALGAAAASAAAAPAPYAYGECWYERRAIVDEDGYVVGRRRVRICR